MREFQLTEKTKDRVLNGALIISLLLLAFGFVLPEGSSRTESPPKPEYSTVKLSPLYAREVPTYEEVALLPEAENTSLDTSSSTPTEAGEAAQPNNKNLTQPVKNTSPKPVGNTKNRVLSVSHTLNKTLKLANLRLF